MHKITVKFFLIFLLLLTAKNIYSQTCGFGCFGLSGFYGGYTFQQYNADGFNQYLRNILLLNNSIQSSNIKKFEYSLGFRVGANLVRFNYKDFIITLKGYYQFLKEEKSPFSYTDTKYSLTNNFWGTGLDFGYSVFSFMDVKFVDAQVTFHTVDLKINNSSNQPNQEADFNKKSVSGYSVGSGLIFKIIDDYIGIELTAGYTNFKIDNLSDENNNYLLGENNKLAEGLDFIKSGGLFVTAQLNVGIPLY
jgi:hypothetical protein